MTVAEILIGADPRRAMVRRLADLSARPNIECYYFGYHTHAGHVFSARGRGSRECYDLERQIIKRLGGLDARLCWNSPKSNLDSGYDPRRDETEGRAFVTHRDGLTALAFWDRSGDRRPNSNSVFVVPGTLTFEQIVRVAKQAWPRIWQRFTFPIVQVDDRGREVR